VDLVGQPAGALKNQSDSAKSGFVELRGETWKFICQADVVLNEMVQVVGYKGLVLTVEKSREA
jgi:membrane-bound ClpP family serine protease